VKGAKTLICGATATSLSVLAGASSTAPSAERTSTAALRRRAAPLSAEATDRPSE
jgi:hypothetical protein